ncbi:apolipoprotein N-acyltransferase [Oceanobacter kriegii]|uniref:apolipoprotein N-acyltransferase n=1 Tax=Oceanobacter kriegii TaxID=64972 RepID=UPI0004212094|nr:apolipoprotein N-acyltransferase [Oceanobacter kriegii]
MKVWISRISLLAAGAIFPLALAPLYWWPLGLVSIAVFCQLLWKPKTSRRAFARVWWYSFGQFAAGVSWVYVSMHDYGGTSMPLAILLVGLFAATLALVPAAVFAIYPLLKHPNGKQIMPWLLIPVFWFLSEWVRSWLFTGFPWLFAGDAHLQTWLAGWAPVIGSYGISIILVLTVSALIQAFRTQKPVYLAALLLWPMGLLLQQQSWTEPTGKVIVSAVQGNINQNMKWKPEMVGPTINLYFKQTRKLWESDLIVWPETAMTLVYDRFLPYLQELNEEARHHDATVITGIAYRYPVDSPLAGEYHNSVIATGMGHGMYHKQRLVPFGEFVPFEAWIRGAIPFLDLEMSSFLAGDANQPLIEFEANGKLHKVASYICYEIAYPQLVSRMAQQSDLLITISNDAWFGDSLGPKQHMGLAQMRALETGRYLLRATNTGITALVDNRGQIVERVPTGVKGALTARAETRTGSTPYMRAGLIPHYLFALVVLVMAAGMTMTQRPKRKNDVMVELDD